MKPTTKDEEAAKHPMIKGSVLKAPREWVIRAYGEKAYREALDAMRAEDRAIISGVILATTWYPIEAWDAFLAAMRAHAKKVNNESELEFDMRNMREAGSTIVKTMYSFLLALLSPESVLEKLPGMYNRLYSQGTVEVQIERPGLAVLRYSGGDPVMFENISHNLPTGATFLLELKGVRYSKHRLLRKIVQDGKLDVAYELTYSKTAPTS